jgi:hypothetical protein
VVPTRSSFRRQGNSVDLQVRHPALHVDIDVAAHTDHVLTVDRLGGVRGKLVESASLNAYIAPEIFGQPCGVSIPANATWASHGFAADALRYTRPKFNSWLTP